MNSKIETVALIVILLVSTVLYMLVIFPLASSDTFTVIQTRKISIEESGNDAYVYGKSSNYTTARTTAYDKSIGGDIRVGQDYSSGLDLYYVYRSFLKFNTSVIPDTAELISVELYFYCSSDLSSTDFVIRVQKWTGDTPVELEDYNQFDGVNYDDGTFNTNMIVQNEYNAINITNFDVINKTGYTLLCIRSDREINAMTPTGLEYIKMGSYDSEPAYLKISYSENITTTPGAGVNYIKRNFSANYTGSEFFGNVYFMCALYNGTGITKIIEYNGTNSEWSIWVYNASSNIGLNMTLITPEISDYVNLGTFSASAWMLIEMYTTYDEYTGTTFYVYVNNTQVYANQVGYDSSSWGQSSFGSIQCNDTLETSYYIFYFDYIQTCDFTEDFEDISAFQSNWAIIGSCWVQSDVVYNGNYALQVPLSPPVLSVEVTPTSVSINRNTTQTFTATANGGQPPYTYKWYVNGTLMSESSSSFNFRTENLGFYQIWCNVTDSATTTAKSNVANCTVIAGSLEITVSPSTVSINLGEYQNVSANVIGGTPPLQYQWYRNGTAVGTNSSLYEINATEWGVGVWTLHCNVTDNLGVENKSNTVNVYISEGVLNVTITPSGTISSYRGLKTDFTCTVSGGIPPYQYEWYVNSQLNATTSTYTLIHSEATTYQVILKVIDSGISSQWSDTTTVNVVNPSVSLTPLFRNMKIGQSLNLTCTATSITANYTFQWVDNSNILYESPSTTNHVQQYTYIPTLSDAYKTHQMRVNVTFNTGLISPYSIWSNNITVNVFGTVKRKPVTVAHLPVSGVSLPIGHLAQKSAFSANGYYWQFYYDGNITSGFAYGYIRYKYSIDTQLWIEPEGSPLLGKLILDDVPFTLPGASPAICHGWCGGVPFTLHYDRSNNKLYLVYAYGSSTGNKSLRIVTATYNETACDWNWGTPEIIAEYSNPRLPVCPSLIIANNGNPFVVFLLSKGDTPLVPYAFYHRIIAYYNGTEWHLYPSGDPSQWYQSESPKRLVNVGNEIYITSNDKVAIFDTTTETTTENWEVSYQMFIPNDPDLWSLASFIDDVNLVVKGRVNGTFLSNEYVVLHADVFNGLDWSTNVASWKIYMAGTGSPETKNFTVSKYLSDYLQNDWQIQNSKIRFWFTSPYRTATCAIDYACYQLENSFDYVIETVPVDTYLELSSIGRTWQTLHVNGYTSEQTNWTKVGASPYIDKENDGSYITTTTPSAADSAYTFENLEHPGGVVHGVYLYIRCISEVAANNYVDVYIYDGTSWQYAHEYPVGDPRSWYVNVTAILNTFEKVNNAELKFVHRDVSANFTIDYAELIVDYDYAELPDKWQVNGVAPFLNAVDTNYVYVTQGPKTIYLVDEDTTISMPVPNMISAFIMALPTHSVNAPTPIYIFWYNLVDVVFQHSPSGYISAFLVAETGQTLIRDDNGFTNMKVRHNYLGAWEDAGEWWNYTLWYMNLTTDINNVFDARAFGYRAGFSSKYQFWNDTLGDYQSYWVNQTDGLYSSSSLASSLTLDGIPLEFHFYENSLYVTRFNGRNWSVLKFLEENSTILRLNYGEDRCFSYAIQSSSYDVKFLMPFVNVTIKAQTMDGKELSDVVVIMNGELIYTPYSNKYDVIGLYTVKLYPEHISFVKDGVEYSFVYYIVEASPAVQYNTAYFEMDVTGDVTITIVYAVGGVRIPTEIPPPEGITYCLPLIFYVILAILFFAGLYLYTERDTWKISLPLVLMVFWLLIFKPRVPVSEMPIAILRLFTVPPWHTYWAIALSVIAVGLLLNKLRGK